ncbi:MAG: CotH kinase family protein [Candidatus Electrothrix communis]|nr:MAG: CotH kinase family protein [Candidatus Electrothrix communis]
MAERQRMQLFLSDPLYEILTVDPGFSSVKSIWLSIRDQNAFEITTKVYDVIQRYVVGLPDRPFLERLDIDIGFKEYQQIMNDRDRAIAASMLTNPTAVKGKIRFNNHVYKIKLRLKGDLGDHWISKQRISFRIIIKGKNSILGFKKFSIHKPRARQHPFDATFQSVVRHAGILSAQHKYVRVFVNGVSWGVMNIEEHISKELLEKQKVKESIVVKFANDKKWLTETKKELPAGYRLSDSLLNLSLYNKKKYLEEAIYRKQFTYITQERLKADHSHLYDIDQYSKLLILTAFWNNYHTLADSNCRHYFNPYTLKLEPIPTDQGRFQQIVVDNRERLKLTEYNPFISVLYQQILNDNFFLQNFQKNLRKANDAIMHIDEDINYYHSFFPLDRKENTKIVFDNLQVINTYQDDFFMQHKKDILSSTMLSTAKQISDSEAALLPEHVHIRHYNSGKLEVYNLFQEPVVLKKILFHDKNYLRKHTTIPGYTGYKPYVLETGITGIQDNNLMIETEFHGQIRQIDSGTTLISEDISNPLFEATPNNLPFLLNTKEGKWEILPGSWDIDHPLTINGSLKIPANTHLRFAENAYLIVQGSIEAKGEKEGGKIVFEPQKKIWKGIYVTSGKKTSVLKNTIIRNTRSLEDGILKLTGGVTFYSSDIEMKNVFFDGSKAEDALNIIRSNFDLTNIVIQSTTSDGLDSDFSTGSIQQSSFEQIKGDGVDFSGSTINLHENNFFQIKDKAISVGEASNVLATKCSIKDVGVGIAVKDGSQATLDNSFIEMYKLSAAMTYIKKDFFDSPSLEIKGSTFDKKNNTTFLRQPKTSMLINDREVTETKFDTNKLYETGIMKK